MPSDSAFNRFAPFLFVLIWATGFISAGAAAPYAEPLSFLFYRYVFAAAALLVICFALGANWPRDLRFIGHCLFSGFLLHGLYLGGVWWAVRHGVPAGVSGIIAALQPILTALLAPSLAHERLKWRQWAGIFLGFIGLLFVISPKIMAVEPAALWSVGFPIVINMLAMLAITLGTFYQKRFLGGGDVKAVTFWQYVGAGLITLPAILMLEHWRIEWNAITIVTMVWSVLGLSIGGILLLLGLIANGAVSRAAAYIFLVPPTAALMAYLLFHETLGSVQIFGMMVTGLGVYYATSRQ